MTNETKQCNKCGEEKPATLEYFAKDSHNKSTGLQSHCKECNKAYRKANKEAIAEQMKAYRKANKGVLSERKKVYRKANKEAITEYNKAYYRTPKGRFSEIKGKAKWRNINFSLPFKLYESQLWGKPCHYCGCEIEATGLDRKDNDKGYEVGNVVPCCHNCNNKKGIKPYEEFIAEVKNEKGNG